VISDIGSGSGSAKPAPGGVGKTPLRVSARVSYGVAPRAHVHGMASRRVRTCMAGPRTQTYTREQMLHRYARPLTRVVKLCLRMRHSSSRKTMSITQ
jgi:hypothetical protein